jgi:hypothetical protein
MQDRLCDKGALQIVRDIVQLTDIDAGRVTTGPAPRDASGEHHTSRCS